MITAVIQSDLTGWVPIDFAWSYETSETHLDRIAWMDCTGVSFSEPFFLQTISRVRSQKSRNDVICTNSSAITNRMDSSFDYQPAGLIFHISRCGSTAVANCIKHCDDTQVVSEYWPLTQYHWHRVLTRKNFSLKIEPDLDALAVKAAAWSLARCRLGTNENLVLKLTSSSLHSLTEINRIWPNVPRLLVVRHPLDVAISSLRGGGWVDLKKNTLRSSHLTGATSSDEEDTVSMSDEEYVARVLGKYLDIAAKNLSNFDLIIRHDELTGSKVREAASIFNLNPPFGDKIDCELAVDAKSGKGLSSRRRPRLTDITSLEDLEAQIDHHAMPKYNDILAQMNRRQG